MFDVRTSAWKSAKRLLTHATVVQFIDGAYLVSSDNSYPGVYIEEDATPTLSVSTLPTAVPLINMDSNLTEILKFNNILDLYEKFPPYATYDTALAGLRAYFECGGGPCYVTGWKTFIDAIKTLGNRITLVVGNYHGIKDEVYTLLEDRSKCLFAILDGPAVHIKKSDLNTYQTSASAAVYYPYLKVGWTDVDVPASAVAAGLYCKNDRTRGVWKSPANVPLPSGYTPKYTVTDTIQADYSTGKAVNMIRKVDERGSVIWGARTLDDSDDWRYVSVRRLFNSVERDLRYALGTMTFEPNSPLTWEKVRSAATSYLHRLWKQGGLAGASENEAYFVQIGKGVTMSDEDIKQGKMIAKIGLAAARPAEFIVLQFTQNMAQA